MEIEKKEDILVDDILDLVKDDIKFIKEKSATKKLQRESIGKDIEHFQTLIFDAEENGHDTKELKKYLKGSISEWNKLNYLEPNEAARLTKYIQTMIIIEENERRASEHDGLDDLDMDKLEEAAKVVLKEREESRLENSALPASEES